MRNFEIALALEKVLKRLEVIDAKVSGLPQVQVQFSSRFAPTLAALSSLGGGSASQVGRVTGKSRACESKILNELYGRGLVSKQKRGHMKIFVPKQQPVLPLVEKETVEPFSIACITS